jgi:phosphopantothenoylcysteine decarboxylase/phosphopantothenate--cysteine ligase
LTAGPTREPLDPVRYLTNRSSGKMGFALASALAARGARVRLVAGPVRLPTPAGAARVDVETAAEMLAAVLAEPGTLFIACAAVADYRPAQAAGAKIKKSSASLELALEPNPDIVATVAALPEAPFTVGFAAETDNLDGYAKAKLTAKGLDLIAANWVGARAAGGGFDSDENALKLFWADGEADLGRGPKAVLAAALAERIAHRYRAKKGTA